MPMISVTDAAQKYSDRAGQSGQAFVDGANRTDKDPTALAAAPAAQQKALSQYTQAIQSGRVARRLNEVGKQGWLAGINEKGAAAYQNGVTTTGKRKWATAMNQWFPIFQSLQNQIATMPKATPQDSINRVAAWINGTIAAKQQL